MDRINYNPTWTETQLEITKTDLIKISFREYILSSHDKLEAIPSRIYEAFIEQYKRLPDEITRRWIEEIEADINRKK